MNSIRLTFAAIIMITLGSAQLDISELSNSLRDLSLNQSSSDILNKTTKIVKNLPIDISKINSSEARNWENISFDLLNNRDQAKPNIMIEDANTDTDLDILGYYSDCTFTLNNTGGADGIAVINFERDNKILLEKNSFFVPATKSLKLALR